MKTPVTDEYNAGASGLDGAELTQALADENTALRRDRDRLNAIEQHKLKVYHFNAPPIAWTCVRNNRCFDAPTLREAIDDAMRESNAEHDRRGGKAQGDGGR